MSPIGAADQFWRLRLSRVAEDDAVDFEWRDDVLYREPPQQRIAEREVAHVEAVSLDEADTVVRLGAFTSADEAHAFLESAEEDLRDLTRSQFEERYFPGGDAD